MVVTVRVDGHVRVGIFVWTFLLPYRILVATRPY